MLLASSSSNSWIGLSMIIIKKTWKKNKTALEAKKRDSLKWSVLVTNGRDVETFWTFQKVRKWKDELDLDWVAKF